MKRFLHLLVFSFLITSLYAQKVKHQINGPSGPKFLKFENSKAKTNADSKTVLKTYVFKQQKDEIKKISTSKDKYIESQFFKRSIASFKQTSAPLCLTSATI